jgi:hypothetical protein
LKIENVEFAGEKDCLSAHAEKMQAVMGDLGLGVQ